VDAINPVPERVPPAAGLVVSNPAVRCRIYKLRKVSLQKQQQQQQQQQRAAQYMSSRATVSRSLVMMLMLARLHELVVAASNCCYRQLQPSPSLRLLTCHGVKNSGWANQCRRSATVRSNIRPTLAGLLGIEIWGCTTCCMLIFVSSNVVKSRSLEGSSRIFLSLRFVRIRASISKWRSGKVLSSRSRYRNNGPGNMAGSHGCARPRRSGVENAGDCGFLGCSQSTIR